MGTRWPTKNTKKHGIFHGAKLRRVDDPFPYSRIIAAGNGMKKNRLSI